MELNILSRRPKCLRGNRSQKSIAAACGLTQQSLARYENGKVIPNAIIVQTIYGNLNVSSDWLLGLTQDGGREIEWMLRATSAEAKLDEWRSMFSRMGNDSGIRRSLINQRQVVNGGIGNQSISGNHSGNVQFANQITNGDHLSPTDSRRKKRALAAVQSTTISAKPKRVRPRKQP